MLTAEHHVQIVKWILRLFSFSCELVASGDGVAAVVAAVAAAVDVAVVSARLL